MHSESETDVTLSSYLAPTLIQTCGTVTSAITHVSLTRTGYNAIDEYVNVVCTTRTSAYSCWLLGDFSDQCEEIRLGDMPIFLV